MINVPIVSFNFDKSFRLSKVVVRIAKVFVVVGHFLVAALVSIILEMELEIFAKIDVVYALTSTRVR